jgi:two-component system sensor histidine kinase BarA
MTRMSTDKTSTGGVLAAKHILIAGNNVVERATLRTVLEQHGACVREAKDGYEAMGFARWHRFDVGILDVEMPMVDGFEAAAAIRHPDFHQATSPHIPLFALTSKPISQENLRFIGAGFDEWAEKPVEESWLVGKLEHHLSRSAPYRPAVRDQSHALRAAGGNHELAAELFQMLQEQLPAQREEIMAMLKAGERESVHALVHKLQGSARYCGAMALQAAGEMLEQSLKLDPVHQSAAIAALNRAVDQLLELRR